MPNLAFGPGAPHRLTSQQFGWSVYEWANAAFATPVVGVLLGPTLTTVATDAADARGFIYPLGIPIAAGAFFPYLVTLSVFLQLLLLPLAGVAADRSRYRRELLALFTFVGAAATIGLFGLEGKAYLLGGILFVFANLSYGAAIVVFNGFLPEIAAADRRHAVSSFGWALGYLGGGLLLLIQLLFISHASQFAVTTGGAVRISLASAGVWWAAFSVLTLRRLPEPRPVTVRKSRNPLAVFAELRRYPQTLLFLLAYLIFADGIHTVTTLATQFGQQALQLSISTLSMVVLLVQFVAFFGCLGWERIAQRIGAQRAVIATLVIWIGALLYAFLRVQNLIEFVVLAVVIGLVLGGSQALSRSMFSLLIPRGNETAYFGVYELSDRGTSWLGPLVYGLAVQFTGNYRLAMLCLIVFFAVGLVLLARVNLAQGGREARIGDTENLDGVLVSGAIQ